MKALVTGGGGFLGRRIVELLLEQGNEVRILARGRYEAVEQMGAEGLQGDLRDRAAVDKAVQGIDTVFHVAALAGFWGGESEYFQINAEGTRNVVDAMREAGVPKLVYTSTPSVVGYAQDVTNGGPDLAYAEHHESPYPASKAKAEQLVRNANGGDLATVSLRPHLIIGPGDNQLMPRVIARASSGRIPIVGAGTNRVDLTYVDNAAWAHLDAAQALRDSKAVCAGKAYFISNGEPVLLWDWLNQVLEQLGHKKISRRVSLRSARAAGWTMEQMWKWLPLPGEPRLTGFLASALAREHFYDMGPAREQIGYRVRVPMDEATTRTIEWLRGSTSGHN